MGTPDVRRDFRPLVLAFAAGCAVAVTAIVTALLLFRRPPPPPAPAPAPASAALLPPHAERDGLEAWVADAAVVRERYDGIVGPHVLRVHVRFRNRAGQARVWLPEGPEVYRLADENGNRLAECAPSGARPVRPNRSKERSLAAGSETSLWLYFSPLMLGQGKALTLELPCGLRLGIDPAAVPR